MCHFLFEFDADLKTGFALESLPHIFKQARGDGIATGVEQREGERATERPPLLLLARYMAASSTRTKFGNEAPGS